MGELKVYLNTSIPKHLTHDAKLAIGRYDKRETMLLAQNPEGTIPRTNNMEIFFRKLRRNMRKISRNNATEKILEES